MDLTYNTDFANPASGGVLVVDSSTLITLSKADSAESGGSDPSDQKT